MNRKNLHKVLFFSMLLCSLTSLSKGQMLDMMGSLGVGGLQTAEGVKSVRQMNNALHSNQVLTELQLNIVDISTSYLGNFQRMPIRTTQAGGFEITFRPVDNGQHYEAYISPMTQDLCSILLNARFDNLVRYRIIDGGSSWDYSVSEVHKNSGLCVTAQAIALILQ